MNQPVSNNPEGNDALPPIEDLESCALEGRQPRCHHHYRIKVDTKYHVVPVSFMTGWQILEVAEKCDPKEWKLRQKFKHGEMKTIGPDDKVDFTTPGVERFVTLPCDQKDG